MERPVEKEYYTFADYLSWDEHDRIELINGEPYMMAAPMRIHQQISGALFAKVYDFLEDKPCEVYSAPFGVRLFEKENDTPDKVDTVVEPDIVIVCENSKLDEYGCKGAPDMIMEILSPSTIRNDRITKFGLYESAGVREYWIIDPRSQTVEVYLHNESGSLKPSEVYTSEDMAKISVLNGFAVDLSKVFPKSE